MEKQRETRIVAVLALLIAIVGISVGFAAMSATLNINGTAEFNPATWRIEFANLSSPQLTGGATVPVAPTLNPNGTVLGDFEVELTKPGDKVVFTFDIRNAGTIDAVIGDYTDEAPTCTGTGGTAAADEALVCDNLIYTLTYTTDDEGIALGNTLTAGQTRNVTLTIEYPEDVTGIPAAAVSIRNLDRTIIYNQS